MILDEAFCLNNEGRSVVWQHSYLTSVDYEDIEQDKQALPDKVDPMKL